MATNKDLLTEAIADAKAVKETAIANAKLALEEAFTPFLKDQLSAKLQEMDKEDKKEKEVKEEEESVEEMDAVSWNEKNNPTRSKSKPFLDPKKVGQGTPAYAVNVNEEEIDEEINLDELLAELDEAKHDSKKGNKEEQKRMEGAIRDDRDHIKDLEKDIKDNEKKLAKLKADEPKDVNESEDIEEYGNKPMYDEDDRDSMKEEKEDKDKDKKKMEESEISEDARTDAEEEGYLDGMKDEKEDMEDKMDDEEIDLEDMSEDDLKGFIEDVIKDMVSAGEIEPGDEFVEDEIEVEDVEDVDVDVEIDEAKEIEEGEEVTEAEELDEKMSNPVMRKGDDEKKKGKFKPESKPERETEKMREELEAAISQVNELKAELNEVNLLNAKLLYTNKIFKAKNLNESKKVKVLKAFDKAKDVAQAKTIYETLNEGLLDKSSINENRVKGSASKATGLEPKNSKQPIIESNDVYNRMRQLAGLL